MVTPYLDSLSPVTTAFPKFMLQPSYFPSPAIFSVHAFCHSKSNNSKYSPGSSVSQSYHFLLYTTPWEFLLLHLPTVHPYNHSLHILWTPLSSLSPLHSSERNPNASNLCLLQVYITGKHILCWLISRFTCQFINLKWCFFLLNNPKVFSSHFTLQLHNMAM